MISLGIILLLTTQLTSGTETLTVEQVVQIALENNLELRNAMMETRKTDFQIAAMQSQMLPSVKLTAIGAQQLSRIDFTLQRGLLGVFPGTGPIPAEDIRIRTPLVQTGLVVTQVAQPITQLHSIRLNVGMLGFNRKVATDQVRAKRQDVACEARQLYYAVQQAESSSQFHETIHGRWSFPKHCRMAGTHETGDCDSLRHCHQHCCVPSFPASTRLYLSVFVQPGHGDDMLAGVVACGVDDVHSFVGALFAPSSKRTHD